jgi:type 1 glutamine amidotransferase
MRRRCLLFLPFAALATRASVGAEKKVLVYTRNFVTNGKGYVHDSIQSGVDAIRRMGSANGFAVDATDDPNVFTLTNLKQYSAIVFANSNNEAFENDAQRDAFTAYLNGGGGLVGIHCATGSERRWPYFWRLMGGKFKRHPKMQAFTVRVKDSRHPSTAGMPSTFVWTDECYYHDNLNPDIKVLLVVDPAKLDDPNLAEYPGTRFGDSMPLAWYNVVDGARTFYTALGHKPEHYSDPILYNHILGGILWAIGDKK